jgi:hypothetical protein
LLVVRRAARSTFPRPDQSPRPRGKRIGALEGSRTCPNGPRTVWRDCYSKVFQARDDKTLGTWQGLQNVLVIFGDPDGIAATSRSDFDLSVVARQPTTMVVGR